MDAWADVEGAIQSALEQRKQNIERLTALSAITILIGAVWLVWPTISSAAKGESGLLTGLGPASNNPNLGTNGSRFGNI